MKLDVGCGECMRGDVNVDVRKPVNRPRPFIQADAENLPFRDAILEEITCFHVIEHVESPQKLLNELIRVANSKITLRMPHRLSWWDISPQHKHHFTLTWWKENLPKLNVKAWHVERTWLAVLPLPFFKIKFPHEIVVTLWR